MEGYMIILYILYILFGLVLLIAICIMGLMFLDMSGKALARFAEWFIRRF
jgi:uncharacterized membrane protein